MISHVENNRTGLVRDGLIQAARVLGVSTDYLLGLTDDPTPAADRDTPRACPKCGHEFD